MEFTEYIGMQHLGVRDGDYVLELELEPRHLSRAERAHGGVLFALLDTALGRALLEALPEGQGCATVELKVNYFRPVRAGRIQARGRLVNLSRSIGYSEGEVRDGEGRLLARATGSFFLTKTVQQSERERV